MANPPYLERTVPTGTWTKRTPQVGDWVDKIDEQVADESIVIIKIV